VSGGVCEKIAEEVVRPIFYAAQQLGFHPNAIFPKKTGKR
jgi:hypothetical protein